MSVDTRKWAFEQVAEFALRRGPYFENIPNVACLAELAERLEFWLFDVPARKAFPAADFDVSAFEVERTSEPQSGPPGEMDRFPRPESSDTIGTESDDPATSGCPAT